MDQKKKSSSQKSWVKDNPNGNVYFSQSLTSWTHLPSRVLNVNKVTEDQNNKSSRHKSWVKNARKETFIVEIG
jgi:hypothetical protein